MEGELQLQFLPSELAVSAIALSRHTLYENAWSDNLESVTGYTLKQLKSCIELLFEMFVRAPNHPQHAIQDKYKSAKYMKVSEVAPRKEMILFGKKRLV